jgi:hypothetical protein
MTPPSGPKWTFTILKAAIESGSSIEEAAEFLCRSGNIDAVERKARELGLIE